MKNKLKIALMQPYLFPYIGYFQLINVVDRFVFFDDIQWIRGGWINRHTILSQNKKEEEAVTLSVSKHSNRAMINEVCVANDFKKDYLLKIEMRYKKAPYFDVIFPVIRNIIEYEETNVAKFVENSFRELYKLLGIQKEFISSAELSNDKTLKGQDKVIDICRLMNADVYINTINGQHLYNKEAFAKEGIELYFLDRVIEPYKQFDNEFVPFLSIVDVLMFNDIEAVKAMMQKGNLV